MDCVLADCYLAEGESGGWNTFVFFNDLDGSGWILWNQAVIGIAPGRAR
ncbi:hypothetical protein ACQEVF_51295 [Nonomuraea polychroma]